MSEHAMETLREIDAAETAQLAADRALARLIYGLLARDNTGNFLEIQFAPTDPEQVAVGHLVVTIQRAEGKLAATLMAEAEAQRDAALARLGATA